MRALWSSSRQVHANLALEEHLVDQFERSGPLLLFYVNAPSLVVGKNQNPWRECDVAWARREGVPIGRRISGGGTVFHDPGNLNYSLILPRRDYSQERVFHRVCAALHTLGVPARVGDGHSLFADDRKFSGNAFCFRGDAVLHHGTILVESDLLRLRRSLAPALAGIETRAIASRPSPVVNLRELKRGLSLDQVRDALLREIVPGARELEEAPSPPAEQVEQHAAWAWVYGHAPAFDHVLETTEGRLTLRVEKGHVVAGVVAWCRDREETVPALAGCRFAADELAEKLTPHHEAWRTALREAGF